MMDPLCWWRPQEMNWDIEHSRKFEYPNVYLSKVWFWLGRWPRTRTRKSCFSVLSLSRGKVTLWKQKVLTQFWKWSWNNNLYYTSATNINKNIYSSMYVTPCMFPRMLLWPAGNRGQPVSAGKPLFLWFKNRTVPLQKGCSGGPLWWMWGWVLEPGWSVGLSNLQLSSC